MTAQVPAMPECVLMLAEVAVVSPLVPRAGAPLLSEENFESTVPAESVVSLFRAQPNFFLRVPGYSMSGVGSRDGDPVAVQQACDARNGNIVFACIDGETALKHLLRDNGHVALVPEYPDHERISVNENRFEIRGIMAGSLNNRRPA